LNNPDWGYTVLRHDTAVWADRFKKNAPLSVVQPALLEHAIYRNKVMLNIVGDKPHRIQYAFGFYAANKLCLMRPDKFNISLPRPHEHIAHAALNSVCNVAISNLLDRAGLYVFDHYGHMHYLSVTGRVHGLSGEQIWDRIDYDVSEIYVVLIDRVTKEVLPKDQCATLSKHRALTLFDTIGKVIKDLVDEGHVGGACDQAAKPAIDARIAREIPDRVVLPCERQHVVENWYLPPDDPQAPSEPMWTSHEWQKENPPIPCGGSHIYRNFPSP